MVEIRIFKSVDKLHFHIAFQMSVLVYSGNNKILCHHVHMQVQRPGRVAQAVGHLTRKSEVLGLIPGSATYFRFSFR